MARLRRATTEKGTVLVMEPKAILTYLLYSRHRLVAKVIIHGDDGSRRRLLTGVELRAFAIMPKTKVD